MIKRIPESILRTENGNVVYNNFTLIIVDNFVELEAACKATKFKNKSDSEYGVQWGEIWDCFNSIHKGNSDKNKDIVTTAKKVANMVLEIEPELEQRKIWTSAEISDVWCAGAIAEDHPEPCFLRKKAVKEPAQGKGEGAYRIIINTDHTWHVSPQQGAITMGAIILVLAQYSPVEIWIQQGWMGRSPMDGITLFPIHRGHIYNPSNLWFWLGDNRKDFVFSYLINHRLFNRTSSGVSTIPALPCDLYLSSMQVGSSKFSKEDLAAYVAKTCKNILFPAKSHDF